VCQYWPTNNFGWTRRHPSKLNIYNSLVCTHPDAAASIQQLLEVLCSIEDLASCTLASVGKSEEWAAIVSSAEDNRESYCKALCGKELFSALYGTYTLTLNEMKNVLKASGQAGQTKEEDSFKEVRSRKRHLTGEAARTPMKVALPTSTVITKNFFTPPPDSPHGLMPLSQSPTQQRQHLQENQARCPQ
jgi:hypothetical protein